MAVSIEYVSDRKAFVVTGDEVGERFRVVVPDEFISEEMTGREDDPDARRAWVEDNLANILMAHNAKVEGGMVRAPWGRVLVEELN